MAAGEATQTVPWWGNGIFIVSAALLGAILALVSTRLSDKRRQAADKILAQERYEREDQQRWDAVIRESASKFIAGSVDAANSAYMYTLHFGKMFDRYRRRFPLAVGYAIAFSVQDIYKIKVLRQRFNKSRDSLNVDYSSLMLVASTEVMAKADSVRAAIGDIRSWRQTKNRHKPDPRVNYRTARDALIEQVRKEVGAKPGSAS